MKLILMMALTTLMTQGPVSLEQRIEKIVPETQNADMSEQCPRYKITNKPSLMPRSRCRFS